MGKYYNIDPETCSLEELEKAIEGCTIKAEYYETQQLVTKRFINSVYGVFGTAAYNLSNTNIAESITLQGQDLIKFSVIEINGYFLNLWNTDVAAHKKISEIMLKKYPDFDAANFEMLAQANKLSFDTLQRYGDSCDGDTMISMSDGTMMRVSDLYDACVSSNGVSFLRGKSFASGDGYSITNYCEGALIKSRIANVIRHKTSKDRWSISTLSGNTVYVTGDHSVMVVRDGSLVKMKPADIQAGDLLIKHDGDVIAYEPAIVSLVGKYNDEYVYDIEVYTDSDNEHNFFGNSILIHNTDSVAGDSVVRTELHPEGIQISDWYDENGENIGDTTAAGHVSVNTTDKALNWASGTPYYGDVRRIIKHKVNKPKWKLTSGSGKSVICTQDHSLVVFRNGQQITVKPDEILPGDKILVKKSNK